MSERAAKIAEGRQLLNLAKAVHNLENADAYHNSPYRRVVLSYDVKTVLDELVRLEVENEELRRGS